MAVTWHAPPHDVALEPRFRPFPPEAGASPDETPWVLVEVIKDFKIGPRTRAGFTGSEDAATEKQLQFLRNLGVDPQPGLTKVEASKLIDATLAEEACVYSVA